MTEICGQEDHFPRNSGNSYITGKMTTARDPSETNATRHVMPKASNANSWLMPGEKQQDLHPQLC